MHPEEAQRESRERLAGDLAGMHRLYALNTVLSHETDLHTLLDHIVGAANETLGTDRGCVQLVSRDGQRLEMFAYRGYEPDNPFVQHFLNEGSEFACDAARQMRQRLIIEDVENFPPLAGTVDREVALGQGIRATQSTPIYCRKGELIGMLSNQFDRPHRSTEDGLRLVDLLASMAGEVIARHRVEAALRESDERHRHMLRQMPGFVAMLSGPDLRFTYVNDAYVAMSERSEIVGRRFRDVFADITGQGFHELFEGVLNTGEGIVTRGMEIRLHGRADPQYVDFVLEPIRDDHGVVTGVFVGGYETTEINRGNIALRERAEELQTVLDAVPAAIWIARDADSREITGNQMSYDLLRLSAGTNQSVSAPEGIRPTGFKIFHQGRELSADELPVQRAAAGAVIERFEEEIRFEDGTITHVYGNAAPLHDADGQVRGAVAAFVDITEAKRAEAALRDSEEKYRSLFDMIDAGFCIVEMKFDDHDQPIDYKIVEANPAFEKQTGLKDAVGKWVSETAPDLERHWHETYGRVALTGETARFENQAAPFGERWYDVHAYRVGEPRAHRVAILFHDISERKRAEQAIAQLNSTLEQRVEERTAELVHAQDALRQSQKLEAMGQLTGGVAHDFNNLLTPIVGSLDLLQRKGLGDAREQRLIDGALQSAERARILVERLLAFARRQPLQPCAVDVAELVAGMADLVASTSGPKIRLEVSLADDLSPALADPNQLEMAILNLAVNARDAMRDGGTLTIAAVDETIAPGHRSTLAPGRYVHLSVADDGVGMDDATLARAIEPFFSTKGVGKGTGLGLSMVHGLASQLGGALTVSSKPGLGTSVDLWLPVGARITAENVRPLDPQPGVRTLGTVLLVDDEELVRMSTADMLTDLGYQVVEAASAEAALAAIDGGISIDLLVTDHLMPGMSGADLARNILVRSPGTPVLIVSGYADADDIAPDLPRMTKPFRQADLAARIAAMHD